MGIPLQIAQKTGQARRFLRRYKASGGLRECNGVSYHNAKVAIEDIAFDDKYDASSDNWPHDDPRWPRTCEKCSYEFTDSDAWQRNDSTLYRLPDGTEFASFGSFGKVAPPGTMIRADWYDNFGTKGEAWLVSLPDGGEWITTQEATGGGYWTVVGTPPNITVTPSIWHDSPRGWHGFITNGELVNA